MNTALICIATLLLTGTTHAQQIFVNDSSIVEDYNTTRPEEEPRPFSPEQALVRQLFQNYDTAGRPLLNASRVIKIHAAIMLKVVEEVNTERQTMTSSFYLHFTWSDELLQWNESEQDIRE